MRDKIRIELSSESRLGWEPFYAVLDLPATAQQIRDARQKARITGREDMTYQSVTMVEFEPLPNLEHIRLDTTSVEELNYLAQRLDSLSDEQFTIYQALFDQRFGDVDSDELLSVKDLINMTYGLDSVMVASNIHNDEQLGQFVIENDLHPDIEAIPDDSLYLLDKRRIGELQRKNEGGVLIEGFYVVTGDYEFPEVYDGKNIPAAADDGVFRLKVGLADLNDPEAAEAGAVWIALPIPRADADAVVRDAFGVDSIEDCACFDFESGIPQITAVAAKEMSSFGALNAVADRYLTMGTDAQLRFKAILEAEEEKEAAILRAEAKKEAMIREAEGRAQAIEAVQRATAEGIRFLNEADPSKAVLTIKSLEAFEKAADGKATKIIIPSEIQGVAGLAKAVVESVKETE